MAQQPEDEHYEDEYEDEEEYEEVEGEEAAALVAESRGAGGECRGENAIFGRAAALHGSGAQSRRATTLLSKAMCRCVGACAEWALLGARASTGSGRRLRG